MYHSVLDRHFASVVEIFYVTTQLLTDSLKHADTNLTRATFQSYLQSVLFVLFLYTLLTPKIEEKQFPARRNTEKMENGGRAIVFDDVQKVSFMFTLFAV
jgi:hypothetical protein